MNHRLRSEVDRVSGRPLLEPLVERPALLVRRAVVAAPALQPRVARRAREPLRLRDGARAAARRARVGQERDGHEQGRPVALGRPGPRPVVETRVERRRRAHRRPRGRHRGDFVKRAVRALRVDVDRGLASASLAVASAGRRRRVRGRSASPPRRRRRRVRGRSRSFPQVGVHGAGVPWATSQLPLGTATCCGVVELFPPGQYKGIRGHGNFARSLGFEFSQRDIPANKLGAGPRRKLQHVAATRIASPPRRHAHHVAAATRRRRRRQGHRGRDRRRRGHGIAAPSAADVRPRGGPGIRGRAKISSQPIPTVAAFTEYPRRGRGAAATRRSFL